MNGWTAAVQQIRSEAGEHYDPTVVAAFLAVAREFEMIYDAHID